MVKWFKFPKKKVSETKKARARVDLSKLSGSMQAASERIKQGSREAAERIKEGVPKGGRRLAYAGAAAGAGAGRLAWRGARGVGEGVRRLPEAGPEAWRAAGRGVRWSAASVLSLFLIILLIVGIVFASVLFYNWIRVGSAEAFWDNVKVSFSNLPIIKFFKEGLARISEPSLAGDVWTAEVDENINKKLGLFINEFSSYGDIYPTEPIVLFANIEVASLSEEGDTSDTFKVGCDLEGNDAREIYPKSEFPMMQYSEQTVECRFGSWEDLGGSLGGSAIANLKVDYGFITKGYLKVYFMDEKELNALRGKGVEDILNYYGLKESTLVVSQYTSGPVEVALGVGRGKYSQPIGLSTTEANVKYLGITIKNKWDGEISKIDGDRTKFQLPKGIDITEGGNCPFAKASSTNEFIVYTFDSSKVDFPIDTFRTFSCYLKIDENKFLPGITQTDYRIQVNYVYSAKKSTTVRFRDIPIENGGFLSSLNIDLTGKKFDVRPVSGGNIGPYYGYRSSMSDFHDGIDFGVPTGTSVRAVGDGKVIDSCEGYCGGYGKNLIIEHDNGLYSRYNHLSNILVSRGNSVSEGQVIAKSGNTGHSTGPHLDLKIYDSSNFGRNTAVNPDCFFDFINAPVGHRCEDCKVCGECVGKNYCSLA